jgi:hypothetical protein
VKHCSGCKGELPRTDFYRCRTNKDGLDWRCKTCRNEYNAEYRRRMRVRPEFRAKERASSQRYKRRLRARMARNPRLEAMHKAAARRRSLAYWYRNRERLNARRRKAAA